MIRIHHVCVIFICLLIVSSCDTKESLTDNNENKANILENAEMILSHEELASIANDNPTEVSNEQIENTIKSFLELSKIVNSSATTKSEESSFTLLRTYKYKLSDRINEQPFAKSVKDNSLFDIDCSISGYIIEIAGDCYYLVFANDTRFPKVIALLEISPGCESLDTDIDDYLESNVMLNLSYESLYNYLYEIEVIKDSLRESTLEKLSKRFNIPIEECIYENIKDLLDVNTTKSNAITFPSDSILSGTYPLIDVSWDVTDSIMKDYMPFYSSTERIPGHPILGATMQMLSFIRPDILLPYATYEIHGMKQTMSINWNLLTNTSSISNTDSPIKREMAGRLLRYLSDVSRLEYSIANNSYTITDGTSIQDVNVLLRMFMPTDDFCYYQLETIVNSLSNLNLVFARHLQNEAFVFDGYLRTMSDSGDINTYLHAKFSPDNNTYRIGYPIILPIKRTGYYLVNATMGVQIGTSISSDFIQIIPNCQFL